MKRQWVERGVLTGGLKWLSEGHLREGAGVRIIISLSTFYLQRQRDGSLVVNKAAHSLGVG